MDKLLKFNKLHKQCPPCHRPGATREKRSHLMHTMFSPTISQDSPENSGRTPSCTEV